MTNTWGGKRENAGRKKGGHNFATDPYSAFVLEFGRLANRTLSAANINHGEASIVWALIERLTELDPAAEKAINPL